jgi:hypothetical protein
MQQLTRPRFLITLHRPARRPGQPIAPRAFELALHRAMADAQFVGDALDPNPKSRTCAIISRRPGGCRVGDRCGRRLRGCKPAKSSR